MLGDSLNSLCISLLIYSLPIPQLAARESISGLQFLHQSGLPRSMQPLSAGSTERGMEGSLLCFLRRDYKRRQEAGGVMLAAREEGDQMPALA